MSLPSFKRTISATDFPNEKCRWCLQRIGLVAHAPIPVCSDCMSLAASNGSPVSEKGNLWERLMVEFDSEVRQYRKRSRTASSDSTPVVLSHAEVLWVNAEVQGDIQALNKRIQMAVDQGFPDEAKRLQAVKLEKQEALKRLRAESPLRIAELEEES